MIKYQFMMAKKLNYKWNNSKRICKNKKNNKIN